MLVESQYREAFNEPMNVPDGSIIKVEKNSKGNIETQVFYNDKLLVTETCFNRPRRTWFDSKHRIHRDSDLPAVEEPTVGIKVYKKHGKRHRIAGPAFYTAAKEELYFIDDVELSKSEWENIVKNNNGKLYPKPKFNLSSLKQIAADLSKKARVAEKINNMQIDATELPQLDLASNPKNWKKHGDPERRGEGLEITLDCDPLDDTLRCVLFVDKTGSVTQSYLSVE
jgi:hypothetical protein